MAWEYKTIISDEEHTHSSVPIRSTVVAFPNTPNHVLTRAVNGLRKSGPAVAYVGADGQLDLKIPINSDQQATLLWSIFVHTVTKIPGTGPKGQGAEVTQSLGTYAITPEGPISLAGLVPVATINVDATLTQQVTAIAQGIEADRAEVAAHRAAVDSVVATNEGIMTSVLGSAGTFDTELDTRVNNRILAEVTDPDVGKQIQPALTGYGFRTLARDRSHGAIGFAPDGTIWANSTISPGGRTLSVSTDDMVTWTDKAAAPDPVYAVNHMWWTLAGTMIAACANKIYRSPDNGATWTLVLTLPHVEVKTTDSSFTQHASGRILIGEYGSGAAGTYSGGQVRIHQSSDDGATWTVHSSFAASVDNPGPDAIRHIHVVKDLPSGLWCCTGDPSPQAGIWKWNGTSWTRMSPYDSTDSGQRWRTVCLEERGGYLYWGRDTGAATPGEAVRAPVGDLSQAVKLADLPTAVFFSAHLDTGEIVLTGSAEDGVANRDQYLRIWVIDTDDKVYEAWAGLRHPSALNSGNYGQFSHGVRVDNNGRILLRPVNMDWQGDPLTTSFNREALLGRVDRGAMRAMPSNTEASKTLRRARVWETTAVTSAPSTTSSGPAASAPVITDMDLTIPASDLPLLVTLSIDLHGNSVGALGSVGLSFELAAPEADNIRAFHYKTINYSENITITAIMQPSNPGPRRVQAVWWTSAGTLTSGGVRRKITVVELGL